MHKIQKFPCLPGYNFDHNIGRTRFPRSSEFDKLHEGVYYLVDKSKSSSHSRYPALNAWGELPPRPSWLSLDGQRLKFNAYFQDSIHEGRHPYRIRLVNISFFLEDGTIKISEPSTNNSGLEQGLLVRRQRIPLADPVVYRYFDILDLNIGKEPLIFGRAYKIYNCDKFTRCFLNRMGIPVPDPLSAPIDPTEERKKSTGTIKRQQKKENTLANFLKYDGKVLRFFGYWDDSELPYGYIHDLEILYYLVDGSMEVIENLPVTSGATEKLLLVKRSKVPKFFTEIEPIGNNDPLTLLNVLGDDIEHSYYVADRSYSRKRMNDCYKECDLAIGAKLNIFGRKVVLTDLDNFTKEYYRIKYGLDDFTPLKSKKDEDNEGRKLYVPPYNGYGSYEDSLSNCFSIVPKKPKLLTHKAFRYENQANDNRILRFGARMISDIPENRDRCFVINIHLFDNTIAILEVGCKTPGETKSTFQQRLRVRLPGQALFTNQEPKYYEPQHFYIGASVNLDGFKFQLECADEYTYNYMERHCDEFPKSNVKAIMSKIRESLRSAYRDFITDYSPLKSDDQSPVLSLSRLREALNKYVDNRITEHEIMIVARHYSLCEQRELYPREYVRALVHTELNRFFWQGLDRLEEDIRDWDRERMEYLSHHQLYTILRSNRIPLEKELINLMLDRLRKNEQGLISCSDLIDFVNIKIDPTPPALPTNLKRLYWTEEEKPKDCNKINWYLFLEDLNLEKELSDVKENDK